MITLSSHIRWPAVVAFALVPMLRIYLVYLTTLAADKTRTDTLYRHRVAHATAWNNGNAEHKLLVSIYDAFFFVLLPAIVIYHLSSSPEPLTCLILLAATGISYGHFDFVINYTSLSDACKERADDPDDIEKQKAYQMLIGKHWSMIRTCFYSIAIPSAIVDAVSRLGDESPELVEIMKAAIVPGRR